MESGAFCKGDFCVVRFVPCRSYGAGVCYNQTRLRSGGAKRFLRNGPGAMNDREFRDLLVEYMGRGFLENILALMRQDPATVRFIPDLMADDAIVVRLGATALVEELAREDRQALGPAVPGLIRLLAHGNPTIRGDAANVLGIIKDRAAREGLRALLDDEHAAVREVAKEALHELDSGGT